jgi:hypothetical protein
MPGVRAAAYSYWHMLYGIHEGVKRFVDDQTQEVGGSGGYRITYT